MGDMGDMYRDLNKITKEEKAKQSITNKQAIAKWVSEQSSMECMSVKFLEYSIIFKCSQRPVADFYPTTNKWRSDNKTYYGNAVKFLDWYDKQ